MSGLGQFAGFLGLSVAAHLALWVGSGDSGVQSAGEGGAEAVTLAAASTGIEAQVQAWSKPVTVQSTSPVAHPAAMPHQTPQVTAETARPQATPTQMALPDAPSAPVIQTAPIKPPKPAPRKARPKPPAPRAGAASRPKQTAAGSGRKQAAGSGSAASSTKSSASRSSLIARWGAGVRDRVLRRKRYPAGSKAAGAVSLRLSLSTSGKLQGVSITRSSGHAALDRAALRAVQSARFPKAPKGLKSGVYAFSQKIRFSR